MQFHHLTTALITLISLSAAAPIEDKRIPILGGFTLSTSSTCPKSSNPPTNSDPTNTSSRVNIVYGGACGKCTSLSWGGPFKTISETYVDPKCTITLFNTDDCSNGGVVTGPNCWAPEGGIKAYKVECPWWNNNPNTGIYTPCYQ